MIELKTTVLPQIAPPSNVWISTTQTRHWTMYRWVLKRSFAVRFRSCLSGSWWWAWNSSNPFNSRYAIVRSAAVSRRSEKDSSPGVNGVSICERRSVYTLRWKLIVGPQSNVRSHLLGSILPNLDSSKVQTFDGYPSPVAFLGWNSLSSNWEGYLRLNDSIVTSRIFSFFFRSKRPTFWRLDLLQIIRPSLSPSLLFGIISDASK